jgi:LmbE family N-acetylglucosaminyl deacetylase
MKKKIVILSPHLDDAVLSCGEHILAWKKSGFAVEVISLFTSFQAKKLSPETKRYLTESGFSSLSAFEKERKSEDRAAMKVLSVPFQHLNLIDGGFRQSKQFPTYPTREILFAGRIAASDFSVVQQVVKKLEQINKKTQSTHVVIPLGVGQHVDHLIVRKSAEIVFPSQKIWYYADQPYVRNPLNWKLSQWWKVMTSSRSWQFSSSTKQKSIECYKSQRKFIEGNQGWQSGELILK